MKPYGARSKCTCCNVPGYNYTHIAKRANDNEIAAGLVEVAESHIDVCDDSDPCLYCRDDDWDYMEAEDISAGTARPSYTIGERLAA